MSAIPPNMSLDTLLKTGVIRGKSGIEQAFERLRRSGDQAEFHAIEAVKGARQIGESGVAGAILGAVHATLKTGLDVAAPGASAGTKIPLDGVGMAAGFALGVLLAAEPHGAGKTLMNGAAACSSVFAFRQTNDFLTKLNLKKTGITPGGGASLPNGAAASLQPGVISKATFAGEGTTRVRGAWGHGFHPSQQRAANKSSQMGEDPIVAAARGLSR